MRPTKKKPRLALHQIIFFTMGNVMSDLVLAIFSSYLLTFETKVLGLPSNIVGLLYLIPAGIDAFLALLIGHVSDNVRIPYFSKFYGKRKSWHLVGCILVGLFVPLMVNRCFACPNGQTDDWQVVLYYVVIMQIAFSGWGLSQSNFLALIPEIATRRSEMVKLSALSSAVTLICGIYVYVVMWVLLGRDGSDTLSSKQSKEFMYLGIIVSLTGAFFVTLFHIGTRENRAKRESNKEDKRRPSKVFASSKPNRNSKKEPSEDSKMKKEPNENDNCQETCPASSSPNAVRVDSSRNEHANPSYVEDEKEDYVDDTSSMPKSDDINKDELKAIALKSILMQTLPKENMEKACADIEESDSESFESSSYEDGDTSGVEDLSSHESTDTESIDMFMPETFMDMVPYLSNVILSSRRCSKVSDIGYFTGHHSRSSSKIYQRSTSQRRRFSKDDNNEDAISSGYNSRRNSKYNYDSPSLSSRQPSRAASRVYRHSPPVARRYAEEECDDNLANEYSHDSPSLPGRQKSSSVFDGTKSPGDVKGILSSRRNSRMIHGSPRTLHSRIPSTKYQTSPLTMEETTNEEPKYYYEEYSVKPPQPQGVRFSITSQYLYDTPGVETIQEPYQPKDHRKPWEKLLKNPIFYKLGGAYMFTRLAQNITNSYMPLYLTDHLKYNKNAIAYFPLVILVSGVFSSFGGKKLNKLLGNKWTFCLGAILVMAASGWFYLLTEDTRLVMYIPAIMSGSGTSIMFVTTLTLAAEFVDADRGSGAFLMASIGFIGKIVSGILFCLLQEYSPKASSSGSPEFTEYVRHVFSLTPGVAALLGIIAFILFIPATIQCKPITQMEDAETQTDEVQIVEIPAMNTLDIITEDEKEEDSPETFSDLNTSQDIKENHTNMKKTEVELEGLNTAL